MEEKEALVALNLTGLITVSRLKPLLEVFGSAKEILFACRKNPEQLAKIDLHLAEKLATLKEQEVSLELSLAKKRDIKIITYNEPEYPTNLHFIEDAPVVLYMKGAILDSDIRSIAIVGCRNASLLGLRYANEFAAELAQMQITIISGLARGIDTASHIAALKVKGRTVGVLGSGLANIYPKENIALAARIAESGAVISEFPLNCPPFKNNFPRRNRIISGLSLGVLIVEAARNSGALITADYALEQAREVFVLPGNIDQAHYLGCNLLIQQGAKLVICVQDILEELPSLKQVTQLNKITDEEANKGLSCFQLHLYNIISAKPTTIDELVASTGKTVPEICSVLFQLELKGLISTSEKGLVYRRESGRKKSCDC
ncbi:MAG: DNA-processing protein DprA [Candidatus Omnitrophica bacterium]|nr:DNA-processing protein DprA [Candidatus Omnitrophota bacterium]